MFVADYLPVIGRVGQSMCSLYTSWAARENGEGQPLTLIAWLSTSACQTGSKYNSRSRDEISVYNKLISPSKHEEVGRLTDHEHRVSTPSKTPCMFRRSNVSTICSRSRGSIWVVNRKYFTCIRSSASARCASINSESENMRIFSLGAYCRTC